MRQTMSIAYLQPAGNALAFICPPLWHAPRSRSWSLIFNLSHFGISALLSFFDTQEYLYGITTFFARNQSNDIVNRTFLGCPVHPDASQACLSQLHFSCTQAPDNPRPSNALPQL